MTPDMSDPRQTTLRESTPEERVHTYITQPNPVGLVAACYLALLRIPHTSPLRMQNQSTMASCVDFLATCSDRESEDVQTDFEQFVIREQMEGRAPR
jgi:hypothetical protein